MKKLITVFMLLALGACGGTTPTQPTAPQPASVAANWTGNFASGNWPQQAVNMTLSQSGTTVSGTWSTPVGGAGWDGQITGTVDATSFTGTFTISMPNAAGIGPRCTGTASISGPAGGTTLKWTGAGFTGSCNGEPINLTWNLQRQ